MTRAEAKRAVAENIKTLRENKGLSQADLARSVSTSRQRIFQWENQEHLPRLEELEALSLDYGFDLVAGAEDFYDRKPLTEAAKKAIGYNIRKRRKELKLTQEALARELGTHASQVCAWEKGRVAPSTHYVGFLEDALKVPDGYFDVWGD